MQHQNDVPLEEVVCEYTQCLPPVTDTVVLFGLITQANFVY